MQEKRTQDWLDANCWCHYCKVTLSDVSIKNPVFAWMLMIGLIVFGWISFARMGISQLPDVDFPIISVSLTLEGAAPEVMETEVTDVVEDVLNERSDPILGILLWFHVALKSI